MLNLRPQMDFGPYRLERKLGFGGMGEVWLCTARDPAHPFPQAVIKRLHPHRAADETARTLFLDEGRLAGLVSHPNVVRVFESGILPGGAGQHDFPEDQYFIAMEYVEGLDLRRCVEAAGGPLAPAVAASIVADACAGLHHAHTMVDAAGALLNLVHRDIAPDNLIVDVKGHALLVDFGIARATISEATTKVGERKGKLRYMAPEYATGDDATPASDVYSMGATLFELVTGNPPFSEAESIAVIGHAMLTRGLPRADQVNAQVPVALADILASAVQREPTRRLQTAKELERRLRIFLEAFPRRSRAVMGADVRRWMGRITEIRAAEELAAKSPAPRVPAKKKPMKEIVPLASAELPMAEIFPNEGIPTHELPQAQVFPLEAEPAAARTAPRKPARPPVEVRTDPSQAPYFPLASVIISAELADDSEPEKTQPRSRPKGKRKG